jgi:hypothetical protein
MKSFVSSKILSVALVAAAFAAVGAAPASAQALSHDGSLLPHYYDNNGDLKWGGWAPPAAEQQATAGSHKLYLYAKPHASRARVH